MIIEIFLRQYPSLFRYCLKYGKGLPLKLFRIKCRFDSSKSPLFDKEQIEWIYKHIATKDYPLIEE